MNNSLTVELRNNISEVSRVGDILEEYGWENNLPPDAVNALALALDEIVTNIISYGYDDNEEHSITVKIFIKENFLNAIVKDDARPFNPLEMPEVNTDMPVEERRIGGLGIHLVKKMMDSVDYEYCSGKNIFKMKKKIK
jgi:anti-sigma regulatory factor (Ser/Thr protein kinase)